MNYFAPNSPSKAPAYEGPIDCMETCDGYVAVMNSASKVRWLLDNAIKEARNLEDLCKLNSIECEPGIPEMIEATQSDACLTELIKKLDEETSAWMNN